MKQKLKILATIVTMSLVVGCGSSDSSSSNNDNSEINKGYFIDAPVAGVQYSTTSGVSGATDRYGKFAYNTGDIVTFKIGKMILGKSKVATDGLITPKYLIIGEPSDVTLDNNKEERLTLMLRVLQTLDSDHNTSNGIAISSDTVKTLEALDKSIDIKDSNESELLALDKKHNIGLDDDFDGKIDVDATTAKHHFESSKQDWENNHKPDDSTHKDRYKNNHGHQEATNNDNEHGSSDHDDNEYDNGHDNSGDHDNNEHGGGYYGSNTKKHSTHDHFNLANYPKTSTIDDNLTNALKYMRDEEGLAYDIYMALYKHHKTTNNIEIRQLENIATKSEIRHIKITKDILARYNIATNDNTNGTYSIEAIQTLYNTLLIEGKASQKDALLAGCIVEVTDINDLDKYITIATKSNATDILKGFKVLRSGSYKHYWAFDKALKNLGEVNGCVVEDDDLLKDKSTIYPK